MGLEISGRLHAIFDTAQVSERFTKREFVLELTENPKYPQLVQFQLTGDRVGQLDQFKVGDEVTLEFSLRGREWKSPRGETKYFNSLDVWRIEPGRNVMAGGGGRGGGGGRRDDARGGGGGGDPRGGGGGGAGAARRRPGGAIRARAMRRRPCRTTIGPTAGAAATSTTICRSDRAARLAPASRLCAGAWAGPAEARRG
jgi:single-strand DNA-binding protein